MKINISSFHVSEGENRSNLFILSFSMVSFSGNFRFFRYISLHYENVSVRRRIFLQGTLQWINFSAGSEQMCLSVNSKICKQF